MEPRKEGTAEGMSDNGLMGRWADPNGPSHGDSEVGVG
jgi:hypothetical protein